MYVPPAFRWEERPELHGAMRAARLATLVTSTEAGLMATPLPIRFRLISVEFASPPSTSKPAPMLTVPVCAVATVLSGAV